MFETFYMGIVYRDWEDNFWIKGDYYQEKLKVVDGEIIFPEGAVYLTIEDNAFENAPIKKFDFSKVDCIGEWGFSGSQIEEADLSKLYICHDSVFGDCKQLRRVVVGSRDIGKYAFDNCTNLETIELLDGVTRIGECAFSGTKIKTLKFPESVREFDLSAILSTPLEELNMPQKANVTVTFPSNYRRECFPKLSRKSYLLLLKFYPQAYYELMPSEFFGSKFGFDKSYDTLCQNAILSGLKMRGASPSEVSQILSHVTQRSIAEKKKRISSHYARSQEKRAQYKARNGGREGK